MNQSVLARRTIRNGLPDRRNLNVTRKNRISSEVIIRSYTYLAILTNKVKAESVNRAVLHSANAVNNGRLFVQIRSGTPVSYAKDTSNGRRQGWYLVWGHRPGVIVFKNTGSGGFAPPGNSTWAHALLRLWRQM